MKLAIILSGNTYRFPYLSYYINQLNKENINYKIICWNRQLINEGNAISFNLKQSENKGYLFRLMSYIKYKNFVITQLKQDQYDKIIVSTIAIGVLLYPFLKKKYKKKYIFDIRDYSLIINFCYPVFTKLINDSYCTVISSDGFKKWLPKNHNYYITHNFPFGITQKEISCFKYDNKTNPIDDHIVITTIGSLRDYSVNKKVIDALKNNERFYLNFIGVGPAFKPLKDYASKNNVLNINFYGYYEKKDELKLLSNSNFINNLTYDDLNSKTLITNRFYLSVVLGIPMIVKMNTNQAVLCNKFKLGCVLNTKYSMEKQVMDYVINFNEYEYNIGRDNFIKIVSKDTKKLDLMFLDFILIN